MTTVSVIIEMPAETNYKYEHKEGILVLDRVLNHYTPSNYGYVSGTMAADGDPIDCFVVSTTSLISLAQVTARVIGEFKCLDQGVEDNKLVAVLMGESHDTLKEIKLIKDYLTSYKKGFEVLGYESK